jgi:hypothetical protein
MSTAGPTPPGAGADGAERFGRGAAGATAEDGDVAGIDGEAVVALGGGGQRAEEWAVNGQGASGRLVQPRPSERMYHPDAANVPPSTGMTWPVTKRAMSDARKTTTSP